MKNRYLLYLSLLLTSIKVSAYTGSVNLRSWAGKRKLSKRLSSKHFSSASVGIFDDDVRVNSSFSKISAAAAWHKRRRNEMLKKYPSIRELELSKSESVAFPLLILSNISLAVLAVCSGSLSVLHIFLLALFPGSMFSLWQLQILHDCLHGSLLSNNRPYKKISKRALEDKILFWCSMPSAFGYYLYLKYGHLTHHRNVGSEEASLARLFDSKQKDFEDGDVLFVAHRMDLKGDVGPKINGKELSISKNGFRAWLRSTKGRGKRIRALVNIAFFACSFLFERAMLILNDFVVALTGTNFFFPNKPQSFHKECASYCRYSSLIRIGLMMLARSWKALLFLYLAETLWSIPPHPASAMFITNHGSNLDENTGDCIPSSSTYSGKLYSLFTLGTNYHCEHHDFPTVPLNKLGKLREIAPDYYRSGSSDNLLGIMENTFAEPEFYACLDSTMLHGGS